jgi:hypothetical protein
MRSLNYLAFFSSLVFSSLFSETLDNKNSEPSREKIESEIKDVQKEFEDAKKIFNPWYTGPLLAPSAHIIPPRNYNLQPYLFITGNYGKYSESGSFYSTPTLFQVNPQAVFQFGIIDWMDGIVTLQGVYNKENNHSYFNIGDFPISLGFGLLKEGPYCPALLFSIKETFPTGKYQKLNPEKGGIDGIGDGSYQTSFYLNTSKVVWWWSYAHPMAFRLSLEYTIPSTVKVKGFNTYGGGYGTNGKVHPGQSFSADFGYEFSFNQKWVGALDIVYNYSKGTHFSGYKGVDALGKEASVGGPFNDQLSLAPAIEYNVNENFGYIVGVWFTVWGRNSTAFASGVFSLTYTF